MSFDLKLLCFTVFAVLILVCFYAASMFDKTNDSEQVTPKPAHHYGVSAPAPKKTIIYEDYNEDGEPEYYQLVPLFDVE